MAALSPAPPRIDFDSDALQFRLQMTFPADPSRVDSVVGSIMKMISAMECARGHEGQIELALSEALANAVIHGAGNDPSKSIQCRVACEEQHGMLIVVSDPGDGFDPTKVTDPLQAENLYFSHGRGIFLINRLMDQVEFRHGGTEIHMHKHFKEPRN